MVDPETGNDNAIKKGAAYSTREELTLNIKQNTTTPGQEVILYFTQNERNLNQQNQMYVFKISSRSSQFLYVNCYTVGVSRKFRFIDRDQTEVNVDCDDGNTDTYEFDIGKPLLFKFDGYYFFIYEGSNTSSPKVRRSPTSDMNYMSAFWEEESYVIRTRFASVSVPMSKTRTSKLVSPPFTPSSSRICLALVMFSASDIKDDVLQVHALESSSTEHFLYSISNLKAGWQTKRVDFNVTISLMNPIKLSIKKVNDVEVRIGRISPCNSYGSEVQALPNIVKDQLRPFYKLGFPAYSATSQFLPKLEVVDGINSCMNGGVNTTAGCACTPGFTGTHCQTGCGKNRFGQDCGGRCSFRSRGCEGFLLCSPVTGCQCAPGYTGQDCTTRCSDGLYGNGCTQLCGHCASDKTCDRFTGHCTVCSIGYVPPYCQQEYVYYPRLPHLVSEKYGTIEVKFNFEGGVKGQGEAKIYQVQYREKALEWKTYITKMVQKPESDDTTLFDENKGEIKETIEHLKSGILYEVRVLLMDKYFNKYDGELIQSSTVLTRCDVPGENFLKVKDDSNDTAVKFSWTHEGNNPHDCPIELYEVSWLENYEWTIEETESNEFVIQDLVPGVLIEFKVRAKTTGGPTPYSSNSVSTSLPESDSVRDLQILSSNTTSVEVAWNPPIFEEGRRINYTVTYKCVQRIACEEACQEQEEKKTTLEETKITLDDLQPFTQYLISVRAEDGPSQQIYVGTTEAEPTERPITSDLKPIRSNTSVTVFWKPQSVCSSFIQGYFYTLERFFQEGEFWEVLAHEFTSQTNVSFINLSASTHYTVMVFINTNVGWNPNAYLAINFSTSATVPEAVQNLTVYKRGRHMLGVRWAEPRAVYGTLHSFTVQYSLGSDVTEVTVKPSPCPAWPQLYCHTLEHLVNNRNYSVTVSARNSDLAEDGAAATVSAFTRESAPSPPGSLNVINSTATSVGLRWSPPHLLNGVLRSFLVNVEESERLDSDSCCQDFPLIEIPVKEETKFYEAEISGLHPASTYQMSVSAKTISMGLSSTLVVYTRPPHLPFNLLPDVEDDFVNFKETTWLPQGHQEQLTDHEDVFSSAIRAHLVLATYPESIQIDSGIKNKILQSLLEENIHSPFAFLLEYNETGVVGESEWGVRDLDLSLKGGPKQLIAVQISDYNGAYNVDLRYSDILDVFEPSNSLVQN